MPHTDPAVRRAFMRRYQLEWIRIRREEWIAANGPCQECGSWDNPECDHRDPSTKAMPPRALWSLAPDNPRRIAELAKCQVLCQSCHAAKSASEHAAYCANRHARPVLSQDDVRAIADRADRGESVGVIAREFGINRSTVYKIRSGQLRRVDRAPLTQAA